MRRVAIALTVLLAAPWTAAAQHDQHAAFGDKLGTVHFETSCAASTRADFDRAVALLHSFEYRPAMESFNKVLAADSVVRDRATGGSRSASGAIRLPA